MMRRLLSLLLVTAILSLAIPNHPLLAQSLDEIRAELEAMFESDQRHRSALGQATAEYGRDSPQVQALWDAQQEIDTRNLDRLHEIIHSHGWPAQSQVGERAALAAFLVVQHAGVDQQKALLPVIQQAADSGEAQLSHFAMLQDRILVAEGHKQLYGTQLSPDPDTGQLTFNAIEDPANVDTRRKAVGLPPIREFARAIGVAYPDAE